MKTIMFSFDVSSYNLKGLKSRSGVSNSVSYAGHLVTKKGLAGRIKRKNISASHNWRLKVPLNYKKT